MYERLMLGVDARCVLLRGDTKMSALPFGNEKRNKNAAGHWLTTSSYIKWLNLDPLNRAGRFFWHASEKSSCVSFFMSAFYRMKKQKITWIPINSTENDLDKFSKVRTIHSLVLGETSRCHRIKSTQNLHFLVYYVTITDRTEGDVVKLTKMKRKYADRRGWRRIISSRIRKKYFMWPSFHGRLFWFNSTI